MALAAPAVADASASDVLPVRGAGVKAGMLDVPRGCGAGREEGSAGGSRATPATESSHAGAARLGRAGDRSVREREAP